MESLVWHHQSVPEDAGKLFLVATPIGNLEDITQRALRVLRECDVVAAEDTRRTGRLLKHFEIEKPLLSCHQHNEARRADELIARIQAGEHVALVSDAGTPGISDPGERFVRRAIAADVKVESVPGACALVNALSASG
ncbi:MAG: 16S rRNA (cytidine(1402)-2'-O)-methyltransferase, partial [Limisphaerales bacterium]